mmetsp:Transcript_54595/g.90962  ORF Transcript_54595/g.90962 Transcript_54595/m.90962 type:complete len:274 (+) Transcript_54595:2086-2907(+)
MARLEIEVTGVRPIALGVVELSDLLVLLIGTIVPKGFSIRPHLVLGLGKLKRFSAFFGQQQELNCCPVVPRFLAVLRHEGGSLSRLGAPHDDVGLRKVVQVLHVQAHNVVHVASLVVCFLCLFVLLCLFLGLAKLNQDLRGLDAGQQFGRGRQILLLLNVDVRGLVKHACLLVQACRVRPLLHLLENLRALNAQLIVPTLYRLIEPLADVPHADGHSGHTRRACLVVLRPLAHSIVRLLAVLVILRVFHHALVVHVERGLHLPLELQLLRVLP